MRHLLPFLILLTTFACQSTTETKKDHSLHSPNHNIQLQFHLQNGIPHYSVTFQNRLILRPSELGLTLRDSTFPQQFTLHDSLQTQKDTTWAPVWGQKAQIQDHYHEMKIVLAGKKDSTRKMTLYFRTYDDGIAFRYHIPKAANADSILVLSENTAFRFAENLTTWSIPADFDSYEHLYRKLPLSELDHANTPLTLEQPGKYALAVHEAALTDYAGMTLRRDSASPHTLHAALVPWPDGVKVRTDRDLLSPWRTLQIAENPLRLAESDLILNLNPPRRITQTDWIRPMKYIGIWWEMHLGTHTWHDGPRHGATTERTRAYIDFAAKNDIPAVLVEGWNTGWDRWGQAGAYDYVTPYADFDLEGLVAYAREKGVSLIGHHETGGDIPTYARMLDSAFTQCARLGIPAVKTGYAGKIRPEGQHHHGQWMVRHYRDVVETAARHRIMLDAHEPIKPTGVSRTWPNMMTREGVRGMEWNAWSKGNPPAHTTILPFTRGLAGPIDYTPGIFDLRFDREKPGNRVNATLANQLALYVVLYSPLNMAADLVERYEGAAAFEFIRRVPVNWEETRFVAGEIGNFVAVARRNGTDWWLGAVTDGFPRAFEVETEFLEAGKEYVAEVWMDSDRTHWAVAPEAYLARKYRVTGGEDFPVHMAPAGGMAVHFRLAEKEVREENLRELMALGEQFRPVFEGQWNYGVPLTLGHLGTGAKVNLKYPADTAYVTEAAALCDGLKGHVLEKDTAWLGFQGKDLDAILDFGKVIELNDVGGGFLREHESWIFWPKRVTVMVSEDGQNWEQVGIRTYSDDGVQPGSTCLPDSIKVNRTTRYLRLIAQNRGVCPPWHSAAGKPAWLFLDEIIIE
ncbi:MAG: glycoside hydrolase family 97 catalytic domain-containing protein [Bacteroidota bacterium]